MKLIIFGATGGTGIQIVKQALEHGHTVTAFVRNPEKLDLNYNNPDHTSLIKTKGDVLDYPTVEKAVKGQDAVFCALGLPAVMDNTCLRTNGTRNIIRAMEKTGVKRLICQSSAGVGDSKDTLPFFMKYIMVPLILRRVWADHTTQEDAVQNSQLDWIIARPTALTNGLLTKVYQHGYTAENKTVTSKISRADTAHFMLNQLTNNDYLHKAPCISY